MIKGAIVAIVTPMQENGQVDLDALTKLVDFQIENGTNAIVSVGTTGESATLSFEEHEACILETVKATKGRVPVIAGTGSNSTEEAIYLANLAKKAGCAAHLSVAPYYNKPNQRGILAHYEAIANVCDLPLILYNVPGRTASDIQLETALTLSKIPHVIGIKEASTREKSLALLEKAPADFAIYCGDDALNFELMNKGAAGVISVTANVAPHAVAEVCRLAVSDPEKAKAIDDTLQALHHDLFIEPSPMPVKWALARMGLIKNVLRLPLVTLDPQYEPKIEQALQQAGIVLP